MVRYKQVLYLPAVGECISEETKSCFISVLFTSITFLRSPTALVDNSCPCNTRYSSQNTPVCPRLTAVHKMTYGPAPSDVSRLSIQVVDYSSTNAHHYTRMNRQAWSYLMPLRPTLRVRQHSILALHQAAAVSIVPVCGSWQTAWRRWHF